MVQFGNAAVGALSWMSPAKTNSLAELACELTHKRRIRFRCVKSGPEKRHRYLTSEYRCLFSDPRFLECSFETCAHDARMSCGSSAESVGEPSAATFENSQIFQGSEDSGTTLPCIGKMATEKRNPYSPVEYGCLFSVAISTEETDMSAVCHTTSADDESFEGTFCGGALVLW